MPSQDEVTRDASIIRGASLLSKDMTIMEEDFSIANSDIASLLTTGALNCMALHKKGLYIGGKVC